MVVNTARIAKTHMRYLPRASADGFIIGLWFK
jgi:hypothetical protein